MKKIIKYKKEYFCLANDLDYYIIHIYECIQYHSDERFEGYKYKNLYNRNLKDSFLTFYAINHFKEDWTRSPDYPVLLLKQKEDYFI